MLKVLIILLGACLSTQSCALPCFLTMVKDNCWTNYTVTVDITNASNGQSVASINVPQGQSWARQEFNCKPADKLSFRASFTPVFWEQDEGKTYSAQRNWSLPETVAKGDTAWNITMCYSSDFSEVPLPPGASGNCACDTSKIPPVKPQ